MIVCMILKHHWYNYNTQISEMSLILVINVEFLNANDVYKNTLKVIEPKNDDRM